MSEDFDADWLVVGSGFGGSVSALRLATKGYSVEVLECGRRFADEDFASSAWDVRRYFWAPRIGMRGILRITPFRDVLVASGCGVGGGSLGYANTLYVAPPAFYRDPQWAAIADWEALLTPHYAEAQRMLGVTTYASEGDGDRLMRHLAQELDCAPTYASTRVGVFFNDAEPGEQVPDPYFGGTGPARTGCTRCGSCMVGCRVGAKNTLVKNYLWFAERAGVRISAERTVTDIRPLGPSHDGTDGYEVVSERSGAWVRKRRRTHRARGVVVAAGTLGTNLLLQRCRVGGSLPRISARLGDLVRTNSEAILAVTAPDDRLDFSHSVSISSSIYPDPHTHIEPVTYGRHGDAMRYLFTLLTGQGTRVTRPLKFLGQVARHPRRALAMLDPRAWSRRTVILLVMQSLDNAMRLEPKRGLLRRSRVRSLRTRQDPLHPNPTFIPVANRAAELAAEHLGGIAQSGTAEALFNIPGTAHVLGGAVIGADPSRGVVDVRQRVFGYEHLLVCDGAAVPANVGVNPSLTITALAEHALSYVPPKAGTVVVREEPEAQVA